MRRGRSFCSTAAVVAIVAVGLLGSVSESAGRVQRAPCPDARYVVQGGPLLPGAPASQVDVVSLTATPPTAALSIGCDAEHLKGRVKLVAVRKGTKVAVRWQECGGLPGKIRLTGLVTDRCARFSATLRASGLKIKRDAQRSVCGDGFHDADGAEACERGGAACASGAPCNADCTCPSTTTTTSSSTSTTTTLPAGPCNPLTQQGCSTGEKCTWVTVQDTPEQLGMVGCVPDGAVPLAGACTQGPAGETTGFDDCTAGNICVQGVCKDICGFDGSAAAACASGFLCTRYAGLFANGSDDPIAGGCTPTCNPVTQQLSTGQPCPTGQGCYLLTSQTETIAVCAGAGTLAHGQTIVGPAFANSCLPGHMPRLATQGASTMQCGALCQMTDVYQGVNEANEGGATPYTCESKGAAAPSDATNGESCRYWWAREPFDTLSPYSDTVGWCFRHTAFQYDSNGDMTLDAPFPRCIGLTTGDVAPPIGNPPHNDAQYFWCFAAPAPGGLMLPLDRIGGWR